MTGGEVGSILEESPFHLNLVDLTYRDWPGAFRSSTLMNNADPSSVNSKSAGPYPPPSLAILSPVTTCQSTGNLPRPGTVRHSVCQPGTPRVRSSWSRASRRRSVALMTASVRSMASSMASSTSEMARCSAKGGSMSQRDRKTSGWTRCCPAVPAKLLMHFRIFCGCVRVRYKSLGSSLSPARTVWNSVVPNPNPPLSELTSACFPFCRHGVIFANRTSLFSKYVYPLEISPYGRLWYAITPLQFSPTAAIGTKVVGTSIGMFRVGRRGFTSATSSQSQEPPPVGQLAQIAHGFPPVSTARPLTPSRPAGSLGMVMTGRVSAHSPTPPVACPSSPLPRRGAVRPPAAVPAPPRR